MIRIAAADPSHDDARPLLDALSDTLRRITGSSGRASFSDDDVRGARACFLLARDEQGRAVGCGALRPLDGDAAELKRMFARPGTQGVGHALLEALEERARQLGYRVMRLETRRVNQRALAFYARHGYCPIANYGRYQGRDEAVCMEKAL